MLREEHTRTGNCDIITDATKAKHKQDRGYNQPKLKKEKEETAKVEEKQGDEVGRTIKLANVYTLLPGVK